MQSAARVGILLVVFVILLFGAYAVLGKTLLAKPLDRYFSDLPDAGGVTEGTPVLLAGVNVGTVTHIALLNPKMARMTLDLKHGTQVPAGTQVVIPTPLIGLGQSPVVLTPPDVLTGTMADASKPLPGKKGSPLDSLLPNSKDTVAELTRTMSAVRKLLEDQKLKGRVATLLASTNESMQKFGKLADDFHTTLSANQANLTLAVAAASKAMANVQRVSLRVAQIVESGKYEKNLDKILARVQLMEQHADELVLSMNKLVNDPKLREPAQKIAANVADMTETGKKIATNAEAITKNGETISKNGIEISQNVAVVSKKAIDLTDKASELETNAVSIEKQLQGVLDKVGGFFSHTPSASGFKIGSDLSLTRESNPGRWRTDVTLNTAIPDGTLYAGIYDAFETNRLTIQVGRNLNTSLAYRYGIYASKPGLGVDFGYAKRVTFRADAWDINNPRLDLLASYDFGHGISGWAGVERVFHENNPTIGVSIQR